MLRRVAATYLSEIYMGRLRRALEILPEGDLWWRPHSETTSVGNLLLHLEGNVRQWILGGIGGVMEERDRPAEFGTRDGAGAVELLDRLDRTVGQACEHLRGMAETDLDSTRSIQGFDVTVGEAIVHVLEHFSWHCGQVTWIAKARAGETHGLAFYDDAELERRSGRQKGGRHVGGQVQG